MKAKLDGDTIQKFFVNHGEKFAFAGVIGAACFLLYLGFSKEGFDPQRSPQDLQSLAQQVRSSVEADHWAALQATRVFPLDFPKKALEARKPTDAKVYDLIPFNPVERKDVIKREDPKLVKIEQLRMTGVLGAMTVKLVNKKNPLGDLEFAEAPKIEKPKPKPEKKPKNNMMNRGDSSGSTSSMSSSDSSGSFPGDSSMSSSSEMGDSSSSMGYGGALGPGWKLPLFFDRGYRSGAANAGGYSGGYSGGMDSSSSSSSESGMGMSGGYSPVPTAVAGTPVAVNAWFIAGTAVMPHRKMVEEYERALKESKDYTPTRDSPKYAGFVVSRADVTTRTVDQLKDEDWIEINEAGFDALDRETLKWETNTVTDPVGKPFKLAYFGGTRTVNNNESLTLPIPTLLIKDYSSIAFHPAIPRTLESLRPKVETPAETPEEQPQESVPSGPSRPVLPGMSSNMSSSSVTSQSTTFLTPEYQLIRFYDFFDLKRKNSPQPNRKYVYRVRFYIEDPNYPTLGPGAPPEPQARYLAPDVLARVDRQKADDKKATKDPLNPVRTWWRISDWSDPSEPVSLPGRPDLSVPLIADWQTGAQNVQRIGDWFYGGSVVPQKNRTINAGNRRLEFEQYAPTGKVVAVQWSTKYTTWVPAPLDVSRGSVLNHSAEANVIDPQTLAIKKLPAKEFSLATNAVTLDFYGGEKLGASTNDLELNAPGSILMFDPQGGLKVLDETDDAFGYRMHTYADEAATATSSGGYGGSSGAYPGSGGLSSGSPPS